MNLHHLARHLLLALLLLLSQQLGMVHALSHLAVPEQGLASQQEPDKNPAVDLHCLQCHAFAAVDAALTGLPFAWLAKAPQYCFGAAELGCGIARATPRPFDTRAPPILS